MAEETNKKNEVYDFNKPLLNLDNSVYTERLRDKDGEVIKETEFTVGSMLGHLLWQSASQNGRGLKLMGWARKLYANEEITLDTSDKRELEEWLTHNKPAVFIEGQVQEILEGIR